MPEAKGALALAGPADLDELLALLARFNASQGYAFDAAAARHALSELLARPEVGCAYRIVCDGVSVGYAAPSWTSSSSKRRRAASARAASRCAR